MPHTVGHLDTVVPAGNVRLAVGVDTVLVGPIVSNVLAYPGVNESKHTANTSIQTA